MTQIFNPLISPGKFLLTEIPELQTENKITSLSLLLGLSESVGMLCCKAREEDRYGVVQLSLPEIVNSVTATLKTIEQVMIDLTAAFLFISCFVQTLGEDYIPYCLQG